MWAQAALRAEGNAHYAAKEWAMALECCDSIYAADPLPGERTLA